MENLTEEEKVAAQYMSDHYEDFYPDINGNQNARSNNQEDIDDLRTDLSVNNLLLLLWRLHLLLCRLLAITKHTTNLSKSRK